MRDMSDLIKKVEAGAKAHMLPLGSGKCRNCPYKHTDSCTMVLAQDVDIVISNLKGELESTLPGTPPMILNVAPEPIRIEPIDIKGTLKSIKSMERLEKVAKKATESLSEASAAIRALKEELEDD